MDGTYFDGFSFNYTFKCAAGAAEMRPPSCPAWKYPRNYNYSSSNADPVKYISELSIDESTYENNLDCVWRIVNDRTDCPAGSEPIVRLGKQI